VSATPVGGAEWDVPKDGEEGAGMFSCPDCARTFQFKSYLDKHLLVRCAFFDRNLHSRMPLVPTPACDQCHSSRKFTFLTGSHCKLRPNTKGSHGT
jgi:hypothetical protein